jgi:NitT/TauT family transport system substrate-binding protein
MKHYRGARVTGFLVVLALCGCSGSSVTRTPFGRSRVTLQLQWTAQSQFAGYFVAAEKGYFRQEGLDVVIKPGAVDIVPQQVLAAGQADFAIAWVPKALVSREEGARIVNIAQIFQRSGTLEVSWRDSNITRPEDWRGKRVGTWGFGNEFELLAAMRKAGLDPERDLTLVMQPFDMTLLLNREVDAAQATTYNEYAQVLEQRNPQTGRLYQPEDLSVIDFNQVGTAMLQDSLWAREEWLSDARNRESAVRFLRASFRGWIYCREHLDESVEIALRAAPTQGRGHMTWQLNEVNKLIWPSRLGIGIVDPDLWQQTITVATSQRVLQSPPDAGAQRTDLAQQVVDELRSQGRDVTGASFVPRHVEVTEGGR